MKVLPLQLYVFLFSGLSAYAFPYWAQQVFNQSYWAYNESISVILPALQDLGQSAVRYVDHQLAEVTSKYPDAADKIDDLKKTTTRLVDSVEDMRTRLHSYSDKIDFDEFYKRLSVEVDLITQQIKQEISEPPDSEDETDCYRKRKEVVLRVLDKIEDALVKIFGHWEVPEQDIRENFSHIKPHILRLVLIVGNLADNYPVIVEFIFSGAVMPAPYAAPYASNIRFPWAHSERLPVGCLQLLYIYRIAIRREVGSQDVSVWECGGLPKSLWSCWGIFQFITSLLGWLLQGLLRRLLGRS